VSVSLENNNNERQYYEKKINRNDGILCGSRSGGARSNFIQQFTRRDGRVEVNGPKREFLGQHWDLRFEYDRQGAQRHGQILSSGNSRQPIDQRGRKIHFWRNSGHNQ